MLYTGTAPGITSEMLREQHLRKVEDSLVSAIDAAKIAGMSNEELLATLKTLLSMEV